MNITQGQLADYIKQFNNKKVLIVGDVMIDSYMWGKVNRISPEAPIPIVSVTGREFRLGGAANVALNIKSLGADPILCSIIGDDEKAGIFRDLLKKHGMSDEGIISCPGRKTTTKTRIISGSQHLLRVDDEIDSPLENIVSDKLISAIKDISANQKIDIIIFEDYDKGVLTDYNISKIIAFANSKNIYSAVDPKKRNFSAYQNVSLFKPNHKEFCEGIKTDIPKNDLEGIKLASSKFLESSKNKMLLLTLSEQGVFAANIHESFHRSAVIRDISDVSGAGDTVISVAALLLCSGADISTIAFVSNIAGGLVCEKAGVVPINTQELLNEFSD